MGTRVIQKRVFSTTSLHERMAIAEAVRVVLEDPDFGLELTDEAKRRLQRSMNDRRPAIPFEEIKRRYR